MRQVCLSCSTWHLHWSWAYLCRLTEPTWCHRRSEWKWSVDVCTSEWNTYTFAQLWGFRLSSQHRSYQRTELHNLHCIWLVLTVCLRGPVVTKHSIWMMWYNYLHDDVVTPWPYEFLAHGNDVWCGNKGMYALACISSRVHKLSFPIGIASEYK